MKPKHGMPVLIILTNGEIHEGHWLKDINKFERGVNRWRIYRTGRTVPDPDVLAWVDMDDIKNVFGLMQEGGSDALDLLAAPIHYNIDL